MAGVMTGLRGAGAPLTTVAECKTLSAADMADFHEARPSVLPRHADLLSRRGRMEFCHAWASAAYPDDTAKEPRESAVRAETRQDASTSMAQRGSRGR